MPDQPEFSIGVDPRTGIIGLERAGAVGINGEHFLPGLAAIAAGAEDGVGMRAALDDFAGGLAGIPGRPETSAA
jgi:hypothetical protein